MLRLANQLAVFPGVLEQYGRRAQTRSDHLKLVLKYLDWKPVPTGGEPLKDLEPPVDRVGHPAGSLGLGQPVPDPPLTRTLGRAGTEHRFTGLRLGPPKLLHRADQRICGAWRFE